MAKKILAGVAALAMLAFGTPAFAAINSSSFTITTTNRGTIENTTRASSHTGDNTAEGSIGGDGEEGGDVTSDGDNNNGGASSGNGGNGGNAGAGGLVVTGNATAEAGTENSLNGTDVDVDLTDATGASEDMNSSALVIDTDNDNIENNIDNLTRARARTGDNTAEASEGGDGEDAGDITGGVGDFNNGGASSGNGGAGGAGDIGGEVRTGHASSTSGTINLLNTSIIRVRI